MRIESGRMLNDYIQPNKKQYCIPVFQRDYAWTSEQCEKLFEDIVLAFKKDREHFCGSFVYAPLPTRKHIDRYIIIDGQQRFTTLYILIKALADSATDESDKAELRIIFETVSIRLFSASMSCTLVLYFSFIWDNSAETP